jgi:toxin FitB
LNYLLDTNVVSEWTKLRPDEGVINWLAETDEDRIFLSVITLAELRHGAQRLPAGARRVRLEQWLSHDLTQRFDARVLPVNEGIADTWGRLMAAAQGVGRQAGTMDALIAATASHHSMTLVTRNVTDFMVLGVLVANPWQTM